MKMVAGARMGRILVGSLLGLLGVILLAGGGYWFFLVRPANAQQRNPGTEVAKVETVSRIDADTVAIHGDITTSIGLQIAEVKKATRPRTMAPLPGTLNLDSDRLARVHARFSGEIVAMGTTQGEETTESKSDSASSGRPLRFGDHVRKDQLLAVLWSKDLGEKKSEWIDAQSKLNLDRGVLKDLQELYEKGATPERSVREAQRNVDSDIIALKRAEHTLLSWGLKEKEMAEIRAEAEKPDRKAKDNKLDFERWARVEIRSPQDGTIMERNIALHDLVDTSTDLFKIADTSTLVVWASLYEEDLPTIQKLPRPSIGPSSCRHSRMSFIPARWIKSANSSTRINIRRWSKASSTTAAATCASVNSSRRTSPYRLPPTSWRSRQAPSWKTGTTASFSFRSPTKSTASKEGR